MQREGNLLKMQGELDMDNASEFKRVCKEILAEHPKVALNLEQVRFVDSTGLCAIAEMLKKQTVELHGMPLRFQRLLKTTGLWKLLPH